MADKQGNWFKKHKILTGILVLVIIGVIASASSGGSNTKTNSQPSTGATSDKKPTTAKIGEPARDGKFEFTVNSMKCGEKSIGDQFANTKAQGQFCRVNLTVKNISNEPQTLDSTSQYAYSVQGQKYSTNDEAAIYAEADTNSSGAWYNNINPGNKVTGDIFFDVPDGTNPVKVELHDSAFSNGVDVNLN